MSKTRSDTFSFGHTFKKSGSSEKAALILASWFGTGLVPVASGTFGTLGAVPVVLWMQHAGLLLKCVIVISGIVVGIWAADRARHLIGKEDPSQVVIDEVAGFLAAILLFAASIVAWMVFFSPS